MNADNESYRVDQLSEHIDLAAEVLRMLADPTRIRIILALLQAGELSVNSLAEIIGKKPSGTSQHLSRLRLARMVNTRQDGTTIYYRLVDEHAGKLVIEAVKQSEHSAANGKLPPHHLVGE